MLACNSRKFLDITRMSLRTWGRRRETRLHKSLDFIGDPSSRPESPSMTVFKSQFMLIYRLSQLLCENARSRKCVMRLAMREIAPKRCRLITRSRSDSFNTPSLEPFRTSITHRIDEDIISTTWWSIIPHIITSKSHPDFMDAITYDTLCMAKICNSSWCRSCSTSRLLKFPEETNPSLSLFFFWLLIV